jgi:histidine-containing phosphotransfer protein
MSAQFISSAISSGILSTQFEQLRELQVRTANFQPPPAPTLVSHYVTPFQDESNPDFVSGLIALYFEDAAKKLRQLREMLGQGTVEFTSLDSVVHQFKGSSASFGAAEMTNLCISMREKAKHNDIVECLADLARMEEAFERLHRTLEEYSRLEAGR